MYFFIAMCYNHSPTSLVSSILLKNYTHKYLSQMVCPRVCQADLLVHRLFVRQQMPTQTTLSCDIRRNIWDTLANNDAPLFAVTVS